MLDLKFKVNYCGPIREYATLSKILYRNQKALIDPNDFAMMKIDIFLGNILVAH